jgi:hypothetical protein
MVVSFRRRLETLYPRGIPAGKLVQIVDPVAAETGGISDELPPDGTAAAVCP